MKKVLISILITFLLVGAGLFAYCKITNTKIVKEEKEKNEKTNNEKEISDEDIISKLSDNVEILSGSSVGRLKIDNLYREDKITYISEYDKLAVVLFWLHIKGKFVPITKTDEEIKYNLGSYAASLGDYATNFVSSQLDSKQITRKEVDAEYYKLFGDMDKHIPNSFSINRLQDCPSFIYDEKSELYYDWYQCGGTGAVLMKYNNKYTYDGNKYYVYQNVGFYSARTGIYTDPFEEHKYDKAIKETNEDNYKDFNEYKFTFMKKGDNYIFTSVEKLEVNLIFFVYSIQL